MAATSDTSWDDLDRNGAGPGFEHAAFFYDGDDDFVSGIRAFVEEGLDLGQPVMVSVPRVHLELLREHLNFSSPLLQALPMETFGRNPAWGIPAWLDFVAPHIEAGRLPRGVGEPVWPDRTPDELVECGRHEELLNLALGRTPGFRLLCPYDVRNLPGQAIERARRTHPHVGSGLWPSANADYSPEVVPLMQDPLSPIPARAHRFEFDASAQFADLRERVTGVAREAGLAAGRIDDLEVAVSEAMANSVEHAGGGGTISFWSDGDRVVCDVRDRGTITDPLVGRVRPPGDAARGRGIWLIHQLCDLVQMRALDGEQVIRFHVSR